MAWSPGAGAHVALLRRKQHAHQKAVLAAELVTEGCNDKRRNVHVEDRL
jgi:hypothetical protein